VTGEGKPVSESWAIAILQRTSQGAHGSSRSPTPKAMPLASYRVTIKKLKIEVWVQTSISFS